MRPGAIVLTVTPRGPTSRASDFAQPTTPGRTAFESTRLSTGSRTVLDSMQTIRPCPLASRCGRQSPASRTAESSRSSTAPSTAAASRPIAARRAAAVHDQDVERAEGLERPVHEALEILRVGEVAADGEGADTLGLALEQVAAAREHGDVRALLGERLRDREAHPGRRAADDRRAPLEAEVHQRAAAAPVTRSAYSVPPNPGGANGPALGARSRARSPSVRIAVRITRPRSPPRVGKGVPPATRRERNRGEAARSCRSRVDSSPGSTGTLGRRTPQTGASRLRS